MKKDFQTMTERKRTVSLYQQATSPFWFCRTMVNGERKNFSTRQEQKTKAHEIALQVIALAEKTGDLESAIKTLIPSAGKNIKSVTPIETFINYYKEVNQKSSYPISEQTLYANITAFRNFCKDAMITDIKEITPEKIRNYTESKKGILSNNTINSNYSKIKSLFKKEALLYYREKGLNITNPFSLLVCPNRFQVEQYIPFNKETQSKLVNHILNNPNPKFKMIGVLSLFLGLRRGEVDKCETSFINNNTIILPGSLTKSKKPRTIPIPGNINLIEIRNEILKMPRIDGKKQLPYKAESKFLIPSTKAERKNKNPVTRTYRLQDDFSKFIKELKETFPELKNNNNPIHTLRKQYGSVIASNFDIFKAQQFLGHSTPVITSQYYAGLIKIPEIGLELFK